MEKANKLIRAGDLFTAVCNDTSIRGSAFAAIRRHIDAAPAVEAKEVVHGRWIVEIDGNFRNAKCSACGKDYACHIGMLQLQNFGYCPNCGAKMDGDWNGK